MAKRGEKNQPLRNRVYVIEMKGYRHWTKVDVKLERKDARATANEWRQANPSDEFRVRPYVPEVGEKGRE